MMMGKDSDDQEMQKWDRKKRWAELKKEKSKRTAKGA